MLTIYIYIDVLYYTVREYLAYAKSAIELERDKIN